MPKPRKLWHNATIPARQSAHYMYASADVQGDDHPASPCNLAARNSCKAADCEVPWSVRGEQTSHGKGFHFRILARRKRSTREFRRRLQLYARLTTCTCITSWLRKIIRPNSASTIVCISNGEKYRTASIFPADRLYGYFVAV
jgi:hypothetical protein